MRAIIYSGPGDVSFGEVPTPNPGSGEVLIRVVANTICGTDLRISNGSKTKGVIAPRVLGHEVAAVVETVGEGVENYAPGDPVGLCPTYSCGSCEQCRLGRAHLCEKALVLGHQTDGGLAEYVLIPAHAVSSGVLVKHSGIRSPQSICLAEPLSCIIHGQDFLDIGVGDTVLVIGGGAIGLMHAQVAKISGAERVILSEPNAFRRELARDFGADITVDPTTEDLTEIVAAHTTGKGADVTVVCIGVPALVNDALKLTRNRGRVSLFAGFPATETAAIDANLIHYRELGVFGSSNSTVDDYRRAVSLIESGRINCDPLVTHTFPLEQYETAVQLISAPDALKIAIVP